MVWAARELVAFASHLTALFRIAVGVFGFVALFWFLLLSRDGGSAVALKGESRDEHSQDVKVMRARRCDANDALT